MTVELEETLEHMIFPWNHLAHTWLHTGLDCSLKKSLGPPPIDGKLPSGGLGHLEGEKCQSLQRDLTFFSLLEKQDDE